MENLGEYNNREIYYMWTKKDDKWESDLPIDNWLAIIIGNEGDYELIKSVSYACLNKKINYICAVGKASEIIHDIFDVTLRDNRVEKGPSVDKPEDFELEPVTTWHNDFGEGVWFALTCAWNEFTRISKVICLDLTNEGKKMRLINIINKIKNGWLPEDM